MLRIIHNSFVEDSFTSLVIATMEKSNHWERVRLRIETKNMSDEIRTISSHILDTSRGRAAGDVAIKIYRLIDGNAQKWQQLNEATTDDDGRAAQLISMEQFESGIYKLQFDVRAYFQRLEVKSFYPTIEIIIECERGQHYHVPLLLNPYGYSTYRGT